MDVIETLRAEGYLDCLCLQHSHLGSQVPNIIEIRKSVQEACQFFAELRREVFHYAILIWAAGRD